MRDVIAILLAIVFVVFAWGLHRVMFGRAKSHDSDAMDPRYRQIFYTPLKDNCDSEIGAPSENISVVPLDKLRAAIEKTVNAKSFASLVEVVSDEEEDGEETMYRIDYVSPDKIHVLQMSGQYIDEWIAIGDQAWAGALWMPRNIADLPHIITQDRIMISRHLLSIFDQALEQNLNFQVSDDGRTYVVVGSFSNFRNINEELKQTNEAIFRVSYLGYVVRVDLMLEFDHEGEQIKVEFRHSFAAFDRDIPIEPPVVYGSANSKGEWILPAGKLQLYDPPFFDF